MPRIRPSASTRPVRRSLGSSSRVRDPRSTCSQARKAIDSAYVEATTNANCIGLVKLMGRHCGWIAATAVIAARNADVCLIPEMNVNLEKVLTYVTEAFWL